MAKSKYLNSIPKDHLVQLRHLIPSDYHCTCKYCRGFMGEIYNIDEQKYYSNKIRKEYYVDEAGDHLDAGHIIGYRWAIQNLCPEGGVVLDPTVGTGTAIVEALNNGRNAIGIELEYPEVALDNINAQNKNSNWFLFRQGNAIRIDEYLDFWKVEKESIDLIINGTPYPKISGKSSDAPERKNIKTGEDKSFDYYHEENIGITKGDEYKDLLKTMYSKSIKYLKPGGYFVILIKDMMQKRKPYLLHKMIIDIVLENNPEMEHYGFFLHSHAPTTLFQNTYNKRFPDSVIPWYQVGIVLRKKGATSLGFPVDVSREIRKVPYKLWDSEDKTKEGITVNCRIGNIMSWEKYGNPIDNPLYEENRKNKDKKESEKEKEYEYSIKKEIEYLKEVDSENLTFEEKFPFETERIKNEGYKQGIEDSIEVLKNLLKNI